MSVAVGVAVDVSVNVGDGVGVSVDVGVIPGVGVAVGVNVIDGNGVKVGVAVWVGVGVIVGVDVGKSPNRSIPTFTSALPSFSKYSTTMVYFPTPNCTSALCT